MEKQYSKSTLKTKTWYRLILVIFYIEVVVCVVLFSFFTYDNYDAAERTRTTTSYTCFKDYKEINETYCTTDKELLEGEDKEVATRKLRNFFWGCNENGVVTEGLWEFKAYENAGVLEKQIVEEKCGKNGLYLKRENTDRYFDHEDFLYSSLILLSIAFGFFAIQWLLYRAGVYIKTGHFFYQRTAKGENKPKDAIMQKIMPIEIKKDKITPIRGWLIIPAIPVYFGPFYRLAIVVGYFLMPNNIVSVIRNGQLSLEAVPKGLDTLILEIFTLFIQIFLLYYWHKQSKIAPKIFIFLMVFFGIMAIVGMSESQYQYIALIYSAIFIPYFIFSKRVKRTFVN